jgi:hypothetical protein
MKVRMWIFGLLGLVLVTANTRADVQIKPAKDHVDFLIGDELVTRYHTGKFTRPIFWPLKAPGGIDITRKPAKDPKEHGHWHQKSCWFTWGEVVPEGIELKAKKVTVKGKEKMVTPKYVDFWAEGDGQIICTEVDKPTVEKDHGRLATKNEWRMADGKKIMDETRVLHFYDLGKARLIVFDISLLASVCPITFADTKEGAMGVRVQDEIVAGQTEQKKPGKGKIQNAEGKIGEKECWGKVSAWCDYSGPLEGKTVGIAILDDPKNPHPACWHTRDYGLHAANPFGRGKAFPVMKGREVVRLAKGESIHFRYGVLVHEGDAVSGQVADLYQRFVKLRDNEK